MTMVIVNNDLQENFTLGFYDHSYSNHNLQDEFSYTAIIMVIARYNPQINFSFYMVN